MQRKFLITGASSQIGLAILKKIYSSDNEYILQCNNSYEILNKFLSDNSYKAQIFQVDLSKENSIDNFCNEISGITDFISVAGHTQTDLLPNLEDKRISDMISVNIIAPTKISRKIISEMSAKRYGNIVYISSVAASRGNRGQTVYGGTKAYIESFARSLCAEFASRSIRVNCIAPGAIEAGKLNELLSYAKNEVLNEIASKKLGTPEHVAGLVNYLLSKEAEFINGKTITIDGGFMKGV